MAQEVAAKYKSGEELKILEKISKFDLTQWKQARNKTIKMLEDAESKLRQVGYDTGGVKAVSGGSSIISGAVSSVGFVTVNPVLIFGGLIGAVAGGAGTIGATIVKGYWSSTEKKELQKLQNQDMEYLQPFIELNEAYDNAMARKNISIIKAEQVGDIGKSLFSLSVNGFNAVAGGFNVVDAVQAGLLSKSIVGAEVVADASLNLLMNWSPFVLISGGALSIASGVYDIYSGINDMKDCNDAKQFQQLRQELERQRDQIINYQNMAKKIVLQNGQ